LDDEEFGLDSTSTDAPTFDYESTSTTAIETTAPVDTPTPKAAVEIPTPKAAEPAAAPVGVVAPPAKAEIESSAPETDAKPESSAPVVDADAEEARRVARAAKFGIPLKEKAPVVPAVQAGGNGKGKGKGKVAAAAPGDKDKLAARAARFSQTAEETAAAELSVEQTAANVEKKRKRAERFGIPESADKSADAASGNGAAQQGKGKKGKNQNQEQAQKKNAIVAAVDEEAVSIAQHCTTHLTFALSPFPLSSFLHLPHTLHMQSDLLPC
jgi:hypothetical protein